jgi:diketogulonate reductase-like aldo/keto reductase
MGSTAHVEENAHALDFTLTDEEYAAVSRAFPAPKTKVPLDLL